MPLEREGSQQLPTGTLYFILALFSSGMGQSFKRKRFHLFILHLFSLITHYCYL